MHGTLIEDAPIGAQSWFRCGGSADLLFNPVDAEDLGAFMKQWPITQPITVIGGMANTIVRDGGVRGATIQLGKPFAEVRIYPSLHKDTLSRHCTASSVQSKETEKDHTHKACDDEQKYCYIHAGCGALNGNVAAAAVKAGIGGLEFLSGIPGTLGGALRMNAGAYGAEMKDILVGVNAITRSGYEIRLTPEDLKMGYRHTELPEEMIFTSAILKGIAEDYATVKARITDIKARRNDTQPIREKTGGSTFANPRPDELRRAGLPEDTRAWQIVEKVDARGLSIGSAQMSEKHCNFMINTGDATASDLEMLGEEIRTRARETLGLTLHWEIQRIGEKG